MAEFHLQFRKELNESGADNKFGKYPADKRLNADEMGMGLHDGRLSTVALTGSNGVNHGMKGGKSRRFATLCPLFRAEGEQPKKIHIILRGTGLRMKKESKDWDPDVIVHFQKNAWQDSQTWEKMVRNFEIPEDSILFLDGLLTHQKEECIEYFSERRVIIKIGPAKLTDHWQPADCGLGTYLTLDF